MAIKKEKPRIGAGGGEEEKEKVCRNGERTVWEDRPSVACLLCRPSDL